MAVKTVTLRLEAYERLRAARSHAGESFSQVIMRATWPERAITGGELLDLYRRRGPFFTDAELDDMERAIEEQRAVPPADKWTTR